MKLIFVHGWSVTNTNNYRDLPESVARLSSSHGLNLDIDHIYLGKYISFHDEVSLDDIARALHQALLDLPGNDGGIGEFSCITHSTGGPVLRFWADKYYGDADLKHSPLKHLVMLAPANHGSSLAAIGKQRVGRLKAWFTGVEPGQTVLDWLRLGSNGQWALNESELSHKYTKNSHYPFVIAGQGIDTRMYDFLNNYLVENGSDGVIRVAGANMNCRFFSLIQTDEHITSKTSSPYRLVATVKEVIKKPEQVPLAVMGAASHAGSRMGMLNCKSSKSVHNQIVDKIFQCLRVNDDASFKAVLSDWAAFTAGEQSRVPVGKKAHISRYSMLVFRIKDSSGHVLSANDYDILMLAGKNYSPDSLPNGFFVDKQVNWDSGTLVYYVDADKMHTIKDGLFGISVNARPEKGFSYYEAAEFRASSEQLSDIFVANETTYIDITLERQVDQNVFRFSPASAQRGSFKGVKPAGKLVE